MKQTVILATLAAVAAKQEINSDGYDDVTLLSQGLAGAEKVQVFVEISGAWAVLLDDAGVAVELTAARYMRWVRGGLRYAVTKDATVGVASVEVVLKQNGSP
jgi:hypothetical protein